MKQSDDILTYVLFYSGPGFKLSSQASYFQSASVVLRIENKMGNWRLSGFEIWEIRCESEVAPADVTGQS